MKYLIEKFKWYFGKNKVTAKKINKSILIFNENHDKVIQDYYNYVLTLLINVVYNIDCESKIIVGNYNYPFKKKLNQIKFDFQIEHTLVKKEGCADNFVPLGKVLILNETKDCYNVRIQNFKFLNKSDIVIDYSYLNIINIKTSGHYADFSKKLYYISPLIYSINDIPEGYNERDLEIITLFGDINVPRRKILLNSLKEKKINCQNINGIFLNIRKIYNRTKILINIRQTDYHHTLEELRVLPALLSGVVIISEDVPLRHEIPYHEFIIWTSLENIPELTKNVFNNYSYYWHKIFDNKKLYECLNEMSLENNRTIQTILSNSKNYEINI
jgi:hypothetical protein